MYFAVFHVFAMVVKIIYEVWQKSNEIFFLFTKVFTFFKHQCYRFQNSSFGQLYTDGDVVFTFGSSAGMIFSMSVTCTLYRQTPV
jgi:hypothetical protein